MSKRFSIIIIIYIVGFAVSWGVISAQTEYFDSHVGGFTHDLGLNGGHPDYLRSYAGSVAWPIYSIGQHTPLINCAVVNGEAL